MTDYTRSTGSSATMMIRVNGKTVEFWLNSNNSTTFDHQLPYSWTVNGSSGSSTYDYGAGDGWEKLRSFTLTSSQTVTFKIGATGTSGFGGPTTFSKTLSSVGVPDPPHAPVISSITGTSFHAMFTDAGNGGDAIDSRQIGYGTSSTSPQHIVSYSNGANITGLAAGTTYYVWARTGNSEGFSGWSGRVSFKTLTVPAAPSRPLISNIGPASVTLTWTPNASGGSPITSYQIGYGTGATPPTTPNITSATSPKTVTGLLPGVNYNFWVRAVNSYGASAWSALATATTGTSSGVLIKVGFGWKLAVPYVRQGGVWKIARPWTNNADLWEETT